MTPLRLSIIIPSFNGKRFLAEGLPSVVRAVERATVSAQIVVVDDGSTDGTLDWLADQYPAVQTVPLPRNRGVAAAAAAGLRAATGDWIALLNNDVVVSDDWIVAAFAEPIADDVGSLASRILYQSDPTIINSAGDAYATCGVAIQRLDGRPVAADDEPDACFSACAAAAFYRRAALAKSGFLRESFGAYYEDVDLGFRLVLAGYRCLYRREATVYHVGSGSYGRRSWRVLFLSARNKEIVFWGNMPGRLLIRYLPTHLFMVTAQLAWSTLMGELLPKLCGTVATVLRIPEIIRIRREVRALRAITPRQLKNQLWADWGYELIVRRLRRFRPAGGKQGVETPCLTGK